MQTAEQIITDAANLVENGWTHLSGAVDAQDQIVLAGDSTAAKFCMIGAIHKTVDISFVDIDSDEGEAALEQEMNNKPGYFQAIKILAEFIRDVWQDDRFTSRLNGINRDDFQECNHMMQHYIYGNLLMDFNTYLWQIKQADAQTVSQFMRDALLA